MSAHVQLVDPGSRFVHREGTLTGDAVLRLPLDEQVKRAIAGRILRKVAAPAAEESAADKAVAPPAAAPVTAPGDGAATEPKPAGAAAKAAAATK